MRLKWFLISAIFLKPGTHSFQYDQPVLNGIGVVHYWMATILSGDDPTIDWSIALKSTGTLLNRAIP